MISLILPLTLAAGQADIDLSAGRQSLVVKQMLAVPPVGRGARIPFSIDPIQEQIVKGEWKIPVVGDSIMAPNGSTRTWIKAEADKDGWFSGPAFEGGYAYCEVNSDADRAMLLDATGDGMVYVNGAPREGDPYGYGWMQVPVELKKGRNEFLVLTGRGRLRVQLDEPKASVLINPGDMTLPDAVIGTRTNAKFGGVVLENASNSEQRGLVIRATLPGADPVTTRVPEIAPFSVLKVRFDIPQEDWLKPQEVGLKLDLEQNGKVLDSASSKLRIRTATQTRKETYISSVDDSVQYYAVVPPPDPKRGLAMMLSLHGASVEAIGQADAYSPKDWSYVVCATNRRPYGFDWEDWGREDGMDVLAIAEHEYHTDPAHTYVTGHSMGGHGTWQFGALFPDRWAAIGVSAGWASFYSYVGVPRTQNPNPLLDILQRASATSNTLDLKYNFADEGVYILHGDADDNVPVAEARTMKTRLAAFDKDLGYHEQPGAGHWWSTPATKGAACLEWPEMMSFLQDHKLGRPKSVDFTTVDLAVSPSYHGIKILQQTHPLEPSRIQITQMGDVGSAVQLTTTNIDRLYISPPFDSAGPLTFDHGPSVSSGSGYYAKIDGRWQTDKPGPIAQIGPFKEAFNNHSVLVYGTAGSQEENAWAFNKARYDSESFWYRGNGALKIISDRKYLRSPRSFGNVILYGNTDTNAAWRRVLGNSPLQVARGWVRVGKESMNRPDLACIFCWRKPGDAKLNGAISGSGLVGMRLTDRIPYFVSGVGLPDWTIDSPYSLSKGVPGVLGAGFFGPNGQVEDGDHILQ